MIINYTETTRSTYPNSFSIEYKITDKNDKLIGSISGAGDSNGDFICIIKIETSFQKKGIGFKSYEKIYNEINSKFPITNIIGSWHQNEDYSDCTQGMSTNLLIFQQNKLNGNSEKTNIYSTPTGKWMKKLGFINYEIIKEKSNCMKVKFTK